MECQNSSHRKQTPISTVSFVRAQCLKRVKLHIDNNTSRLFILPSVQVPFTLSIYSLFLLDGVSRCFFFDLLNIPADVCVEACDGLGRGGPLINSPVGRLQLFLKKKLYRCRALNSPAGAHLVHWPRP